MTYLKGMGQLAANGVASGKLLGELVGIAGAAGVGRVVVGDLVKGVIAGVGAFEVRVTGDWVGGMLVGTRPSAGVGETDSIGGRVAATKQDNTVRTATTRLIISVNIS